MGLFNDGDREMAQASIWLWVSLFNGELVASIVRTVRRQIPGRIKLTQAYDWRVDYGRTVDDTLVVILALRWQQRVLAAMTCAAMFASTHLALEGLYGVSLAMFIVSIGLIWSALTVNKKIAAENEELVAGVMNS